MANLKDIAKMVKQAQTQRTPEQEFLYMLNETMIRVAAENPYVPSKTYKPSSLGGCYRNSYYQVIGAEPEPDRPTPEGVGIGESGTDRHERIQNYIMKMSGYGFDCEWIDPYQYLKQFPQEGTIVKERQGNEVKIYNKILNLSFKCDGIIKLMGTYYIVEIKTEASMKYMGQTAPYEAHKIQASSYAVAFGIYDVIFLYENRDLCNKKPFHVHVTKQDVDQYVIHRIAELENYREQGKVPPKTTNKAECRYCRYPERCKKDGNTDAIVWETV